MLFLLSFCIMLIIDNIIFFSHIQGEMIIFYFIKILSTRTQNTQKVLQNCCLLSWSDGIKINKMFVRHKNSIEHRTNNEQISVLKALNNCLTRRRFPEVYSFVISYFYMNGFMEDIVYTDRRGVSHLIHECCNKSCDLKWQFVTKVTNIHTSKY